MPGSEYRLEMHNISKHFSGVKALSDVSFFVRPGENHALAGENGAGKSTLIKVLSGVHTPDTGEIYINGENAHINNTKDGLEHGGFRYLSGICPGPPSFHYGEHLSG